MILNSMNANTSGKLDYIDAVRGWAILLVIMSHVGDRMRGMSWPVTKFADFGAFGVQLFFLASAVTLMLSWHHQQKPLSIKVPNFFIRRFLRIAPLYYAGAIFYVFAMPPQSFDTEQFLRALVFVNVWRPEWVSTLANGWQVVLGGWSIGIEFTFYLVFPLVALAIRNLRDALLLFTGMLALAVVAGPLGADWLTAYPAATRDDFLYFWFPNQAYVFAAGIVLYYVLINTQRTMSRRTAYRILLLLGLVWTAITQIPMGINYFPNSHFPPPMFFATLLLAGFIFVLAKAPETFLTNRWIRALGTLSFSAYVIHFIFIEHLPGWSGGLIDDQAKGLVAVGMGVLFGIVTVGCTAAVSYVTHRLIERPGIKLARRLTSGQQVLKRTKDQPAVEC
jgi:peptidoglycan/LPS O-acetylase OafA/YrhL